MNWKRSTILFSAFALPFTARADVITDWNTLMRQTFAAEASSATPPMNSRTMGMLGGSMIDAVYSVNRNYESYNSYFDPTTAGIGIDATAAAAAAAPLAASAKRLPRQA